MAMMRAHGSQHASAAAIYRIWLYGLPGATFWHYAFHA
jgi:hypothetical protein